MYNHFTKLDDMNNIQPFSIEVFLASWWKKLIAYNLNRLMERDEVTGAQLTRLLDTTPATISRWRNAETAPEVKMLDKMALECGWKPAEFTRPIPNEPEPEIKSKLHDVEALKTVADRMGYETPVIKKKKNKKGA
jgi:transcriptional regulator with XRE-family HTH domain